MSQTINILILGATGVIGKFITEQIVAAKSHFGRIAIFTSPGTVEAKKDEIEGLKARAVEVIVGDVTREEDVKRAYRSMYI